MAASEPLIFFIIIIVVISIYVFIFNPRVSGLHGWWVCLMSSSRICLVIVLSVYCPVLVMYVLSPTILFCIGCLMFEYENQ